MPPDHYVLCLEVGGAHDIDEDSDESSDEEEVPQIPDNQSSDEADKTTIQGEDNDINDLDDEVE